MKDTGSFEASILGSSRPFGSFWFHFISQLALVSGSFLKKSASETNRYPKKQLHGLPVDPIWFIFPADFVRVPASHIGLPEGANESEKGDTSPRSKRRGSGRRKFLGALVGKIRVYQLWPFKHSWSHDQTDSVKITAACLAKI